MSSSSLCHLRNSITITTKDVWTLTSNEMIWDSELQQPSIEQVYFANYTHPARSNFCYSLIRQLSLELVHTSLVARGAQSGRNQEHCLGLSMESSRSNEADLYFVDICRISFGVLSGMDLSTTPTMHVWSGRVHNEGTQPCWRSLMVLKHTLVSPVGYLLSYS